MDRSNPYFWQVELLVRVLPHVANQGCFALKGGTAINPSPAICRYYTATSPFWPSPIRRCPP